MKGYCLIWTKEYLLIILLIFSGIITIILSSVSLGLRRWKVTLFVLPGMSTAYVGVIGLCTGFACLLWIRVKAATYTWCVVVLLIVTFSASVCAVIAEIENLYYFSIGKLTSATEYNVGSSCISAILHIFIVVSSASWIQIIYKRKLYDTKPNHILATSSCITEHMLPFFTCLTAILATAIELAVICYVRYTDPVKHFFHFTTEQVLARFLELTSAILLCAALKRKLSCMTTIVPIMCLVTLLYSTWGGRTWYFKFLVNLSLFDTVLLTLVSVFLIFEVLCTCLCVACIGILMRNLNKGERKSDAWHSMLITVLRCVTWYILAVSVALLLTEIYDDNKTSYDGDNVRSIAHFFASIRHDLNEFEMHTATIIICLLLLVCDSSEIYGIAAALFLRTLPNLATSLSIYFSLTFNVYYAQHLCNAWHLRHCVASVEKTKSMLHLTEHLLLLAQFIGTIAALYIICIRLSTRIPNVNNPQIVIYKKAYCYLTLLYALLNLAIYIVETYYNYGFGATAVDSLFVMWHRSFGIGYFLIYPLISSAVLLILSPAHRLGASIYWWTATTTVIGQATDQFHLITARTEFSYTAPAIAGACRVMHFCVSIGQLVNLMFLKEQRNIVMEEEMLPVESDVTMVSEATSTLQSVPVPVTFHAKQQMVHFAEPESCVI